MTGGEDATASPNGKSNGNGKVKAKPPFQLCFSKAQEQGKSHLSKTKLPLNACLITPKFYSDADRLTTADDPLVSEITDEIEQLKSLGPKEKYNEPMLESHSYGWHSEPLVPMMKTDRRFNHHRMTSQMVKVQEILLNAARAEKEFEMSIQERKITKNN